MLTREIFFKEIYNKEYFHHLMSFLDEEYENKIVYPPRKEMRKAFQLTPLDKVKVVILGQDPYPNPYQAMGLAFSVPKGVNLPPSLMNIFKEINLEYNEDIAIKNGDLTYLTKQGVLLLNPILTVVEGKPLSHKIKEYNELFIDIMHLLDSLEQPIVFLLWGNNAKKYSNLLLNPKHLVIKTAHPSPLSANQGGWFNSGCFTKCNQFLRDSCLKEIEWIQQ